MLWDYKEHNLSQLHIPPLALLNTAIFTEMKQMYADTVTLITVQDFYWLVLPLYVMGCSDTLKQSPVSVSHSFNLNIRVFLSPFPALMLLKRIWAGLSRSTYAPPMVLNAFAAATALGMMANIDVVSFLRNHRRRWTLSGLSGPSVRFGWVQITFGSDIPNRTFQIHRSRREQRKDPERDSAAREDDV